MGEVNDIHITDVLEETPRALRDNDSIKLRDMAEKTILSDSSFRYPESVTIAVLVYALSKLIERNDNSKIKNWPTFVKKFSAFFDLAATALKERKFDLYRSYLEKARNSLTTISVSVKPYIQEVMRKASLNNAGKLYEQGMSLGQTSKLLGVTEWELAEYTGQREVKEPYHALKAKERAKMALEFFS